MQIYSDSRSARNKQTWIRLTWSSDMKLAVIESPYAGDVERNVAYARECMKWCLSQGYAPYASHLLYTQPGVLDDNKMDERKLGITAGFAWQKCAEVVFVFLDHGISRGMREGVINAVRNRQTIAPMRMYSEVTDEDRAAIQALVDEAYV